MRSSTCLGSAALIVATIGWISAQETPSTKPAKTASEKPAVKATSKGDQNSVPRAREKGANAAVKSPEAAGQRSESAAADTRSPDEEAIRKTAETFARAYEKGDAKAAAHHFTANAEYVDEEGNTFRGREEIEQDFSRFFADNPGSKIEIQIESIHFVDPAVAIEEGTTTINRRDGSLCARNRYFAVHAKTDGKWLVAAVREQAPKGERRHRQQLEQLGWLVGDWLDESDASIVTFMCRPVDDGNFLLRKFTVTVAGDEVMSGSQRIGWDPLTGRLRAWTFDSQGGHFEGAWHRDGDRWVLNSTGVTADGQTASGTSIFTMVNANTITWQAVDHEIDGVRLPDSELYTLVRQGPAPETVDREIDK
ncbi:MAG: SgcJ/EcaC family oxidoreductase [Deltaproteobacteria bacterium]